MREIPQEFPIILSDQIDVHVDGRADGTWRFFVLAGDHQDVSDWANMDTDPPKPPDPLNPWALFKFLTTNDWFLSLLPISLLMK